MNISQKVSNYIGGISQQPDELMPPGSVVDAVNVLPDVTNGLAKRPAGRLVQPLLTNKEGKWFNIYRDNREQYVAKVNRDGTIEVFDAQFGLVTPVTYQQEPYLSKYPEPPGEATGRPSNPNCSVEDLNNSKVAYNVAKNKYNRIEKEYESLIGTGTSTQTVTKSQYTKHPYFKDSYYIEIGHAKPVVGDPYDINKPEAGNFETVEVGNKILDNVNVLDEPDPEGVSPFKPKADIYEYVVTQTIPGTTDEAEKTAKAEELKEAEDEMNAAYEAYAAEATKCGFSLTRADDDKYMEYLVHEEDNDIQVLTVNDYTFITNRNKTVRLSENEEELRPFENFIELINVAYARRYGLSYRIDGEVGGGEYTKVIELELTNGEYRRAGSCKIGSEIVTLTGDDIYQSAGGIDADKEGLVVRLNFGGTSSLVDGTGAEGDVECRYSSYITLISGGSGWVEGDVIRKDISIDYEDENGDDEPRGFEFRVKKITTIKTWGPNIILPPITPVDGSTVIEASQILSDIKAEIEAEGKGFVVEIIGNGLYITHPSLKFTFDTPEAQLMRVTTDEANNIAVLPAQCKNGYVVKIRNTDSDFDDYWVRFEGIDEGIDGSGTWVEYREPGVKRTLDMFTMPHQLVRSADGTFVVSPVGWASREVGDAISNPAPSFVDSNIQNLSFFRNRLVMLSGENAVCSKAGDYWNYWGGSSLVVADDDPIDISSASTTPTVLLHALEVTNGLLCFGNTQQHLLSTDAEGFTPTTARFNVVGTHLYSGGIRPISLGSTTGFITNAGIKSRFMELLDVNRERESTINELSKPVSELMPSELDLIADSKDNNLILFGTQGTDKVWAYRFFQNDRDRMQSAWFRWDMTGKVLFHCIMEDTYWCVMENESDSEGVENKKIISLQRFDLKDTYNTALVTYDGELSTVHLDNYRIVLPTELQYYPHINQTYFRMPLGYFKDERLVAYMISPNKYELVGAVIYPKVEEDNLGTWVVFDGDYSDTRMVLGYEYNMKVVFPTIYPTKSEPNGSVKSDTRANLSIHRVNLNFDTAGVYETTLHRKGKEDYIRQYESTPANDYKADSVAFLSPKSETVPVYERNTAVKLELSSSHPSPLSLTSMSWEGSYTPKFYKNA